ncbi:hypothetical protein N7475_000857 [Penicillium sp. IBT 31633x]|nr:hypothetical protein N7475_000857 [Penicillium sp. IBT 31633x]
MLGHKVKEREPLAKALPKVTEEAIAGFLYKDIFIVYRAPLKFLTDNRANLLATSIEYYIKLVNIKTYPRLPSDIEPILLGYDITDLDARI